MSNPIKTLNNNAFEHAVKKVLENEGGFVNHKSDPGGATNYGISLRFLKSTGIDIDLDGDTDIDDIIVLDKDDAKKIYKERWWDKHGYEKINNIDIAAKIFDFSINAGSSQAHKIAQSTANEMGCGLICDGIFGKKSIDAINGLIRQQKDKLYLNNYKRNLARFYTRLAKSKPELNVFLKGWLRRAQE